VAWNGSKVFTIENGVKQGGIVSPVLFCIYTDGLLRLPRESNVGCFIGNLFVGALAYADAIALLAPTPRAMRHLLLICEEYGNKLSISSMLLSRPGYILVKVNSLMPVSHNSQLTASEYTHLGHTNLDENCEILSKRNSLCGKINNALCYFRNRNPVVKLFTFLLWRFLR